MTLSVTAGASRLLVFAFLALSILYAATRTEHAATVHGAVTTYFARGGASPAAQGYRTKRRLQVIKAGGIPKEGLGSSLGFINSAVHIAVLLDADLVVTQTAEMMGYRVSDIVNRGTELQAGGRVCDVLEVLLDDPANGYFQERMDRALSKLDDLYDRAELLCRASPDASVAAAATGLTFLSDYARNELSRCDTLVINDYRAKGFGYTLCGVEWWRPVIEQYSGPAHGNDVAIHFRWGDMYHVAQTERKWAFNMTKVARVVDLIREANPAVTVNVFMKKSRENESERRMRQLLLPLGGEYNIIEAASDVEELAMMAKARYLVANSGSFSIAAAYSGNAQLVVHNNAGAHAKFSSMGIPYVVSYDDYDEDELRTAAMLM